MDEKALFPDNAPEHRRPMAEATFFAQQVAKRSRIEEEIPKRVAVVSNYGREMTKVGIFLSLLSVVFFVVGKIALYSASDSHPLTYDIFVCILYAGILAGAYFLKNPAVRFYIMLLLPVLACDLIAAPGPFYQFNGTQAMNFALFLAVECFVIVVLGGAYAASTALLEFPVAKSLENQGSEFALVSLFTAGASAMIIFSGLDFHRAIGIPDFDYGEVRDIVVAAIIVIGLILFSIGNLFAIFKGRTADSEKSRRNIQWARKFGHLTFGAALTLVYFLLIWSIVENYLAQNSSSSDSVIVYVFLTLYDQGMIIFLWSGFLVSMTGYCGYCIRKAHNEWLSLADMEIKKIDAEITPAVEQGHVEK